MLFALGLLFGDLLGSSNYPALNASVTRIRDYFLENHAEVRALAFFHLLSAVALLCLSAYVWNWLNEAGGDALAGLAFAGGVTAAGFLLLSALSYRTLAEPQVAADAALTHARVVISYLAGGPASAVALALLIIAASVVVLRRALLPAWVARFGLAAAVFSGLSAAILLGRMNNSSAWYGVLLLSAVLGFCWTFLTSVLLAART